MHPRNLTGLGLLMLKLYHKIGDFKQLYEYNKYMDDKYRHNSDVALNSYLCPNCHMAKLFEHQQSEFQHEWNKCTFCGYSETKAQTHDRVSSYLQDGNWREDLVSKASTENPAYKQNNILSRPCNCKSLSYDPKECLNCFCTMCDCSK